MLRLHGFDVSNYYNMAKCVLLEKQAEFDVVTVYPNQNADYLDMSPMGKVPVLETEHGFLSETSVIVEYLDEILDGPRFYPDDAFARASVRELVKLIEIYIELPARRCYPQAFFGGSVSGQTRDESQAALLKGVAALRRKARFAPYLAGAHMSAADIMFLFSFDLAAAVARKLFEVDLFDELPGSAALLEQLQARDCAQQIRADREAAMADFQKYMARRASH